jgi:hypothetical protein
MIKCGLTAGLSKFPVSCVRFVQPPVFGLCRVKVRQRGACRHDSVGLPYISVLLAMNFTTPEILFFAVKLCGIEVVDVTHFI